MAQVVEHYRDAPEGRLVFFTEDGSLLPEFENGFRLECFKDAWAWVSGAC